jgi:hypothetical protein|tara:strand:- start:138 stop:632 length:495 start_codon:yes stop_codon:yes gene_type:complete
MIRIKDNVLNTRELKKIQDRLLSSHGVPMFYANEVAFAEDGSLGCYYHIHDIYTYPKGWLSDLGETIAPILNYLKVKALVRIKVNFYPRTHKIVRHGLHTDQDFKCKSALFFVNDNDGYTYLKNEDMKVESKANRVLHFNSYYEHHSTTCTDQNLRCTININYF